MAFSRKDFLFGIGGLTAASAFRWRVTPIGVFGQKGRPLVGNLL